MELVIIDFRENFNYLCNNYSISMILKVCVISYHYIDNFQKTRKTLRHVCSGFVAFLQCLCSVFAVHFQFVCTVFAVCFQFVLSTFEVCLLCVCSMFEVC